jgi:glycosyltransferase involved in cell wall biosynthesis
MLSVFLPGRTCEELRPALADRVLFTIQTYPDPGGISSILENYVAALANRYEVHIAIVDERPGRAHRLAIPESRVHVLGYSNLINPLLFPTSVGYAVVVGTWLRRVVAAVHPSLILTKDGLNLPIPALIAAAGRRVKVVVLDHGTLTNVHEPGFIKMIAGRLGGARGVAFSLGFLADTPWRAARWRLGVKYADQLWFTGEELKPWFLRAGPRAREYTQTVPTDFTAPTSAERRAARFELELADSDRVFNVVGRLDGEKGLDTILEALSGIDLAAGPVKVLVAGDGSCEKWFRSQVDRRRLSDKVRLLGRLDRGQIRRLQHASDFHIYAGTISCGVSICLLEAMASGVVPIVSDVPAAQRDLVGSAGWVFRAGRADDLRDALAAALQCSDEEMAIRGAETQRRVLHARTPTVPELIESLINGQRRGTT